MSTTSGPWLRCRSYISLVLGVLVFTLLPSAAMDMVQCSIGTEWGDLRRGWTCHLPLSCHLSNTLCKTSTYKSRWQVACYVYIVMCEGSERPEFDKTIRPPLYGGFNPACHLPLPPLQNSHVFCHSETRFTSSNLSNPIRSRESSKRELGGRPAKVEVGDHFGPNFTM